MIFTQSLVFAENERKGAKNEKLPSEQQFCRAETRVVNERGQRRRARLVEADREVTAMQITILYGVYPLIHLPLRQGLMLIREQKHLIEKNWLPVGASILPSSLGLHNSVLGDLLSCSVLISTLIILIILILAQ